MGTGGLSGPPGMCRPSEQNKYGQASLKTPDPRPIGHPLRTRKKGQRTDVALPESTGQGLVSCRPHGHSQLCYLQESWVVTYTGIDRGEGAYG